MEKKQIQIEYTELPVSELSGADKRLYDAALDASVFAYAPYSRFQVGAAALLENGTIVPGSNQENAAYPSGLCAERVALFAAGALFPGMPVVALAIIAQSDSLVQDAITPCGACCQVMKETEMVSKHPMRILLCGRNTVRILPSVSALLPFAFSADELSSK